MSARPAGRRGHLAQRGLTLIETMVAIAVIAIGVVGISGGVAATERTAAVEQDQANLETAMRELADLVRADPNQNGIAYQRCATPAEYDAMLPKPTGRVTSWGVTSVIVSTAATRNGSPLSTSTGVTQCGVAYDWGVQEIALQVSSAERSLVRTVWKSDT